MNGWTLEDHGSKGILPKSKKVKLKMELEDQEEQKKKKTPKGERWKNLKRKQDY